MFDILTFLNAWPGFICTSASKDDASRKLILELIPETCKDPVCRCCGTPCVLIHDTVIREIREMPILGYQVILRILIRRPQCLNCNRTANERVDWITPYARMTPRLREHIEHRTETETIQHVADETGLGWDTVKEIDRQRLERTVGAFQWDGATRLIVDEFAIHKRHRYATVVFNPDAMRILWVGRGRSLETINTFFDLLTDEQRAGIKAVAMDMSTAFDIGVRSRCPNAAVVYDLFHVLALYSRKVVDRVRVDTANRFRSDPQKRRLIKGSRWLLMKRPESLDEDSSNRLREAVALNSDLMKVSLMGDELRHLWFLGSAAQAGMLFDDWIQKAKSSCIDCLVRFANALKNYKEGIVASASFRLGTSMLEGINNRIKLLKRQAYGFRDDSYFFLKVKNAFPGIP